MEVRGKFYFLTAAHILNDWEPIRNRPDEIASNDSFFIRVFRKENGQPVWLPFSTKTAKEDTTRKMSFFRKPDLFILPLNLPAGLTVYPIQTFLPSDYASIPPPDSVVFYGFPKETLSDTLLHSLPKQGFGKVFGKLTEIVKWPAEGITDSLNYIVRHTAIGKSIKGYSGCPVFWCYQNREPVFGGLLFAGNSAGSYIIRPQVVLQYLEKTFSIKQVE